MMSHPRLILYKSCLEDVRVRRFSFKPMSRLFLHANVCIFSFSILYFFVSNL